MYIQKAIYDNYLLSIYYFIFVKGSPHMVIRSAKIAGSFYTARAGSANIWIVPQYGTAKMALAKMAPA